METIFMNTENSKTNKLYKGVLKLSQRLELKFSNKDVAIQMWSIYFFQEKLKATVQKD